MNDLDLPLSSKHSAASFTRDLTLAAQHDELEPVSCRDAEIERVMTILLRQSKNNPVLIGEAGVGKTAVVEGLAQRISQNKVPLALRNTSILSLNHTDLIAGTSFRGQYEKRLKAVIDEAARNKAIILFIDELHNLIGAGTTIGAPMDAANMLKPALASGQIRVIGATTNNEYDQYIRPDAALERRFQPVRIDELGREQTLQVLRGRRPRLELHHRLAIADDALEAATDLSLQYLPDRKQPDRAIDLLDETCARVSMAAPEKLPEEITALNARRDELLAAEQILTDQLAIIAQAKGNPLERFSHGTFRAFEAVGLGVEKLLTGETTERPPLPLPDSIRQLQKNNPAEKLAQAQVERLSVEDELRAALLKHYLVVTADNVGATLIS